MKRKGLVACVLGTAIICCCLAFFVDVAKGYAAKPICIGVSTDFSGITATFGVSQRGVWQMAVKELNESGGFDGRPVKLIFLDNGADPSKVLSTLKLLKEKHNVVAVLGGTTSTSNLPAKKWAEANHISFMSSMPLSSRLWDSEGKAWWFRTLGREVFYCMAALRGVRDSGYTKIGVEHTTLAWGTDTMKAIEELAPKYGLVVVGDVGCEPKSKDFSIQAKKLSDTGAEAFVMVEYETETGVWARAMKTIGCQIPIFMTNSTSLATALKSNPPELFEGWRCVMSYDPTKPSVIDVWKKYESFTGTRLEAEEVISHWDAIQLLFEAIRLSGNPDDPEAIRDGYYKIKNYHPVTLGRGAVAGFSVGKNHLPTPDDYSIGICKAGKLVLAE